MLVNKNIEANPNLQLKFQPVIFINKAAVVYPNITPKGTNAYISPSHVAILVFGL